jgi:hypothetical protein
LPGRQEYGTDPEWAATSRFGERQAAGVAPRGAGPNRLKPVLLGLAVFTFGPQKITHPVSVFVGFSKLWGMPSAVVGAIAPNDYRLPTAGTADLSKLSARDNLKIAEQLKSNTNTSLH